MHTFDTDGAYCKYLLNGRSIRKIIFLIIFCSFFLCNLTNADLLSDLNSQANEFNKKGNYDDALLTYEKALSVDNRSISSLLGKSSILTSLKKYDDALATYDLVLLIDPKNSAALNGKATAFKNLGKNDDALHMYDQVIELNKSYSPAYNNKGSFLLNLKNYKDAIQEFNIAIELDPKYISPYFGKASALCGLEKYSNAISEYDKIIDIDKKNIQAYLSKADLLKSQNLFKESIIEYDNILSIDSNNLKAWMGKASALGNLKQYTDAISAFNEAIRINETYPFAYSGKAGMLNYGLKKYEQALAEYDKSLVYDPTYYWNWIQKGDVLLKLNRFTEAVNAYEKATQINSADPYGWNSMGNALKEAHRNTEALEALNKALALNPNHGLAIKNKEQVVFNLYNEGAFNVTPNITPIPTVLPSPTQIQKNWWDVIFGNIPVITPKPSLSKGIFELGSCKPQAIAGNEHFLYLIDGYSQNALICDKNGTIITILESGNISSPYFQEVTDITVDSMGTTYLLDGLSHKICKYSDIGSFISSWDLIELKNRPDIQPVRIYYDSYSHMGERILILTDNNPNILIYSTEGEFIGELILKTTTIPQNLSTLKTCSNENQSLIKNYLDIIPDESANPLEAERTFEIKNSNDIYSIKLILDRRDYLGAQKNDIIDININECNPEQWETIIQGYLHDPVTIKTIDQVYQELDKIKRDSLLTDSEFFDLITGFIQQIPLKEDTNNRYPIEVFHDKKGNSIDKSLFLYSLLYRAGYDVVFITYPGTNHCAVGVRSEKTGDPAFLTSYQKNDTTYIYISSDNPAFIGRKSPSIGLSDPFLHSLLQINEQQYKTLPESVQRISILETLYRIGEKKIFLEKNMNKFTSVAQRAPKRDLDKIKTVMQYVESQPWNTEGVYLRLKNSKVSEIQLNYGLK